MKISKKAEQKNLVVKKDYYSTKQLNEMLKLKTIFYFNENLSEEYDEIDSWEVKDLEFRIFTENCKEIKVILDEYNDYNTAVLTNDNHMVYVEV